MASRAGTGIGGGDGGGRGDGPAPGSPRGVPRKIDQLGRVVIPSEYRKLFGIAEGDLLDLTVEGDAVVVRRVEHRCVLCGGIGDLFAFRDRYVCRTCAGELCGANGSPAAPTAPVATDR